MLSLFYRMCWIGCVERWQSSRPSGRSTPPPSSRGCLPAARCRGPASRSGSARDDRAGWGFQPSSWPYDLRLTAAGGDTPCWGPWWVQSELEGEGCAVVNIHWTLTQCVSDGSGHDSHFSSSALVFGCGFTRPAVVREGAGRKRISANQIND